MLCLHFTPIAVGITYARDHGLLLSYLIINLQGDRSKVWGEQDDDFLAAGVSDSACSCSS